MSRQHRKRGPSQPQPVHGRASGHNQAPQAKKQRFEILNEAENRRDEAERLFEEYQSEREDRYRLRFIQEGTPDDEWLHMLPREASFVVVVKGVKARKVLLACRKFCLAFSTVMPDWMLRFERSAGLPMKNGVTLAVYLSGIRPQHVTEFNAMKDKTLSMAFTRLSLQDDSRLEQSKQLIHDFCDKLASVSGANDLSCIKDSPIVAGRKCVCQLVQQRDPCFLLIARQMANTDFDQLKAWYKKRIPMVWYEDMNELGAPLRCTPVPLACIITSGNPDGYDKIVQALIDSNRTLSQINDVQLLRLSHRGENEAESVVSKIYDAAWLPFSYEVVGPSGASTNSQDRWSTLVQGHADVGPVLAAFAAAERPGFNNGDTIETQPMKSSSIVNGREEFPDPGSKQSLSVGNYEPLAVGNGIVAGSITKNPLDDNAAAGVNKALARPHSGIDTVTSLHDKESNTNHVAEKKQKQLTSESESPEESMIGKGNKNIYKFFKTYRQEVTGPYQLRVIYENTPDCEWLGWLRQDVSFILLVRHKAHKVLVASHKLALPYAQAEPQVIQALGLNIGLQDTQRTILAACLTGIRQNDLKAFKKLTNATLQNIFGEFPYVDRTILKDSVVGFCERLAAATGATDLSAVEGGPVIVGRKSVAELTRQGKSRLVLISYPTRKRGGFAFSILKDCYMKGIPFVWYESMEELGDLLHTSPATAACLVASGQSDYDKQVQTLIDSIQELIQHIDIKLQESSYSGSEQAKCAIAKIYDAVGIRFPATKAEILGSSVVRNLQGAKRVREKGNGTNDCVEYGDEDRRPAESICEVNMHNFDNPVDKLVAFSYNSATIDDETIRLEERMIALESAVEATRSRRLIISEQENQTLLYLHQYRDRLVELLVQRDDLRLTNAKQMKLQQDLQSTLEKSQNQLQRLLSPDVQFTQDEISRLARISTDALQLEAVPSKGMKIEPMAQIVEEFDACMSACKKGAEDGIVGDDRMRLLWLGGKDSSVRIGPFLPGLDMKDLILSILGIAASEVLVTDSNEDGWKHRRQCMWNTCLDVRMLLRHPLLQIDDEDRCDEVTQKKLAIDPNIQLCPYELSGECHDEYCAYQHLQERRRGRILPRELLPLPALTFASNPQNKGENPLDLVLSGQEPVVEAELLTLEFSKEVGSDVERDELADNADYVALPEAEDVEDDSRLTDEGDSEMRTDVAVPEEYFSSESSREVWLTHEVLQSLSGNTITLYLLLRAKQWLIDELPGAIKLKDTELARNRSEAFALMGRVVTCVCLALHSGRYDVAQSLLAYSTKWFQEWGTANGDADTVQGVFSPVLQTLQSIESQSFAFETPPAKGIFTNSFEIQFIGAVICCFLHKVSLDGELIDLVHVIVAWKDIATAINSHNGPYQEIPVYTKGEIIDFIKSDIFYEPRKRPEAVDEKDEEHTVRYRIKPLVRCISQGYELRRRVASLKSIRCLVSDIIPGCLLLFMEAVKIGPNAMREPEPMFFLLASVSAIANALLGAIESAATQIYFDTKVAAWRTECLDLCSAIDRVLQTLSKVLSRCPTFELLLSPVHAANIALASTSKAYDRAHQRLMSLVASDGRVGVPSLTALSELLWSQLIQLEASLPTRCDDTNGKRGSADGMRLFSLSPETRCRHELLADRVYSCEVNPHHVTLANDWNLTDILTNDFDEGLFIASQNIMLVLPGSTNVVDSTDFSLRNRALKRRQSRGEPSSVYHKIPQSLLLVGQSIHFLSLTNVGIDSLPQLFGRYFSQLKSLDLSGNELEEIPWSTLAITSLESLRMRMNKLTVLPPTVDLPLLSVFDAADNKLRELPREFVKCVHLQDLYLEGNPIDKSVWEIAAQLPNLLRFSCNPST